MRAGDNWIDKLIHELRTIASVAIQENDDLAFRSQRCYSGGARASVSVRGFHDASAGLEGAFRSSVSAAIVDHYDLGGNFCRRGFPNDPGDRFFFVERGNDDGNTAHRRTSQALVK